MMSWIASPDLRNQSELRKHTEIGGKNGYIRTPFYKVRFCKIVMVRVKIAFPRPPRPVNQTEFSLPSDIQGVPEKMKPIFNSLYL